MIALVEGKPVKSFDATALANGLGGTVFALPHGAGGDIRGTDIRWKHKPIGATVTVLSIKLQGSLGAEPALGSDAEPDPSSWDWYDLDTSTNIAGDSRMIKQEKSRFVRLFISSFTTDDSIDGQIMI